MNNKALIASKTGLNQAIGALLLITSLSSTHAASLPEALKLSNNLKVVSEKTYQVGDEVFTLQKLIDDKGNLFSNTLNGGKHKIPRASLPNTNYSVISKELSDIFKSAALKDENLKLDVIIALSKPYIDKNTAPSIGAVSFEGRDEFTVKVNGKISTLDQVDREIANQDAGYLKRGQLSKESANKLLRELVSLHSELRHHERVTLFSIRAQLSKSQILKLSEKNKLVAGIELYVQPKDTIASAMQATEVDPWAIYSGAKKGKYIGIYLSEGGCPVNSHISDYTRLAGSTTDHSENTTAIVRAVAPKSYLYCRGGFVLPSAADLTGTGGHYRVYVETHSYGIGTTDDYRVEDREFDDHVYEEDTFVAVAAGNSYGLVGSPGKALNVLTVGNYDDANMTIRASSSWGDPETGNEKPEVSAPGTNITAGGHTKTGTSMATPHAAAFAADHMAIYKFNKLRPFLMKALMLAGATDVISGGADHVGLGGINYWQTYIPSLIGWWEGNNSSFSGFDAADSLPNNGFIDRTDHTVHSLGESRRVTLSWLNRGTYTYVHRNDAHPIGLDFDLTVFNPNGTVLGGSYSFDNGFESFEFTPTVTGTYRIAISLSNNRDSSSDIRLGLAVVEF